MMVSVLIYFIWILDYRKAFDSVPHKRLLEMLKTYGINGKLLRWIQSFLETRMMTDKGTEWSATGLCSGTIAFFVVHK